jgi:hypothetical protein
VSRTRMLCFVSFIGLLVWLIAAEGRAQPVPVQPLPPSAAPAPPPPPPPPPHRVAGPLMSKKQLHRYLEQTDEEYASASSRKLGGILLASIGGGVGLATGGIAGMLFVACSMGCGEGVATSARNWMIGGFIGMGISLAVGIPLAVSGNRRMKQIRRERASGPYPVYLPQVNVALDGQGGGQLGLTWVF